MPVVLETYELIPCNGTAFHGSIANPGMKYLLTNALCLKDPDRAKIRGSILANDFETFSISFEKCQQDHLKPGEECLSEEQQRLSLKYGQMNVGFF